MNLHPAHRKSPAQLPRCNPWWTRLRWGIGGLATLLVWAPLVGAETQSPGDLLCYYLDSNGVVHDLSLLCGGGGTSRSAPPLPRSGPVTASPTPAPNANSSRITLTWNTIDDLDLSVQEPSGEQISWGQRNSSSGGRLLRDANSVCTDTRTNPREEISWAANPIPRGEYQIQVSMAIACQTPPRPVAFTLQVNINGTTATFPGTVSPANPIQEFRVQVP